MSSEKQQLIFFRDYYDILALKREVMSEKCDAVVCKSTSELRGPVHDSLVKNRPIILDTVLINVVCTISVIKCYFRKKTYI